MPLHHDALPHYRPRNNETSLPRTKPFETLSQNKPFLFCAIFFSRFFAIVMEGRLRNCLRHKFTQGLHSQQAKVLHCRRFFSLWGRRQAARVRTLVKALKLGEHKTLGPGEGELQSPEPQLRMEPQNPGHGAIQENNSSQAPTRQQASCDR
jgi:hypothetical protein